MIFSGCTYRDCGISRSVLLFMLLSFVPLHVAFGQSPSSVRFRVALKISGDSSVASEIEGDLRQELSLLNDVELSEIKPDYTLNVIVMVVQNKEQVPMGVAMSWLSLYHPKGFFEDCSLIEDYRLLTLEKEEIRGECHKLVARFDAKSLEPHRRLFEKPKS